MLNPVVGSSLLTNSILVLPGSSATNIGLPTSDFDAHPNSVTTANNEETKKVLWLYRGIMG